MNPYTYVAEATQNGESLLSLCCGIGLELSGLNTQDVTAVDIAQQYLDEVPTRCPQAKIVCSDVLKYLKTQSDDSFDVVSIIDGIEHLSRRTGLQVVKHMMRVGKCVLLFTPEGYLRNEPHNAWGIPDADEYQTHKSGWSVLELKDMGFQLLDKQAGISQHGEPYNALMFKWVKNG